MYQRNTINDVTYKSLWYYAIALTHLRNDMCRQTRSNPRLRGFGQSGQDPNQRKTRELHSYIDWKTLSDCPFFFWFEAHRSSPWARTWVDSCLPWTPLGLDLLRCYEGPCEFLSWDALRWGICKLHQRSSWIGFTTLTLAGSRIGPLMFIPGFISPMPQTTESPGPGSE